MDRSCERKLIVSAVAGATVMGLSAYAPLPARAEGFPDLSRVGLRVLAPLDQTWLDQGDTQFSGEAFSNWEITMQWLNTQNGQWTDSGLDPNAFKYDGFSDNPARTDPGGIKWYNWHISPVGLSLDPKMAGPIVHDGDQRGASVEFRFVNKNNGADEPSPYSHFGQNAQQCISDNEASGTDAVSNNCALSKNSVTVIMRCGHGGQACCFGDDNQCDDGLSCDNTTCRETQKPATPPPPPPSTPRTTPPPPPPPTGVWHKAVCECSDGVNFGYVGAVCCGLPDATGLVLNTVLDAACSNACAQIHGDLTVFQYAGVQSNLGTCNASAGTQCQAVSAN